MLVWDKFVLESLGNYFFLLFIMGGEKNVWRLWILFELLFEFWGYICLFLEIFEYYFILDKIILNFWSWGFVFMVIIIYCFWFCDFLKLKCFLEFLFILKRFFNVGERVLVLMYLWNISRCCGEFRVGYVEIWLV